MVQEIIKNIYRIQVPMTGNSLKYLNAYLLRGEIRSLLIDTGFCNEESRTALLGALADLDVHIEQTDLFITHFHPDHSGLVPEIALPSTKVMLSRAEIELVGLAGRERMRDRLYSHYRANGFPDQESEQARRSHPGNAFTSPREVVYSPVDDGELLHYAGYTLRVILCPGHSPAQACLYLEDEQILFTGDHILFDITPGIATWVDPPIALASYLDSLKKLRGLPVRLALPGHRMGANGIDERIDFLLEHHRQRLNEAESILRDNPGLNGYELAGRMRWRSPDSWKEFSPQLRHFAMGETLAHLEYLEAQGRVRKELRDGIWVYFAQ